VAAPWLQNERQIKAEIYLLSAFSISTFSTLSRLAGVTGPTIL
jgi:hypothetical protein